MIEDSMPVRPSNVSQGSVLLINRFEWNPDSASRIWLQAEVETILMRRSPFAHARWFIEELAMLRNHGPNQKFREFSDLSLVPPCIQRGFQMNTVGLVQGVRIVGVFVHYMCVADRRSDVMDKTAPTFPNGVNFFRRQEVSKYEESITFKSIPVFRWGPSGHSG
jgi:hypothetical protein